MRLAPYRLVLVLLALGLWTSAPHAPPKTGQAVAEDATECDVCARRHQRSTRNSEAPEPGRPSSPSETVWFGYQVADDRHRLSGRLYRPDRDDPAPAIVLMHGCAGVWSLQHEWAERFRSWGYVALVMDSFGPRGIDPICEALDSGALHRGDWLTRSFDAYGAHGFLSKQDFVDPGRIALAGWSHGAGVAQRVAGGAAVNTSLMDPQGGQFRSVVAFYPWCVAVKRIRIPLLILIGEADDWTPAARCESFVAGQKLLGDPVDIVVYPNATHSFDGTELGDGLVEYGHFLRYDATATRDAVERVKAYLADQLGD